MIIFFNFIPIFAPIKKYTYVNITILCFKKTALFTT
jgi:hypothetical protein